MDKTTPMRIDVWWVQDAAGLNDMRVGERSRNDGDHRNGREKRRGARQSTSNREWIFSLVYSKLSIRIEGDWAGVKV